MTNQLPTFKGYTVDIRLKEFRKTDPQWGMAFVSFDSPQGEALLVSFIRTLDADTNEGREMLIEIGG
ncbi:MAG: hypothetical protein KC733_06180 [Candidatus Omnitrophica bacterium]|nr:hypothetical protein [Candidatus Omnitrophota bacterium]